MDWLYYLSYIYIFLIFGIALSIASKKKHKFIVGLLIVILLLEFMGFLTSINLFVYAYFIFLLFRKLYLKIKGRGLNIEITSKSDGEK